MNTFENLTEEFLTVNGWTQGDLDHMRAKKTRALRESIEFFAQYGEGREEWRDAMLASIKSPAAQVAGAVKREKLSSEKKEKKSLDKTNESALARIINRFRDSGQSSMVSDLAVLTYWATEGMEELPPVLLTGPAGTGKTTAVNEYIMGVLAPYGWIRVDISPTCSVFELNNLIATYCAMDRPAKVLFFADEIHGLKPEVLTQLQIFTNGEHRGALNIKSGNLKGTHAIHIDPRRHWFIACTNETDKLRNEALFKRNGRFMRVPFQPYPDDKAKAECLERLLSSGKMPRILSGMNEAGRLEAVKYCLPFARSIKYLLRRVAIKAELARAEGDNEPVSSAAKVASLARKAGVYPGGWSVDHVAILRFIGSDTSGKTAKDIKAETGISNEDLPDLLTDIVWKKYASMNKDRYLLTKGGAEFIKNLSEKARK